MATPDSGLRPETTSDHYMAAAVEELRNAVRVLTDIKDVLVRAVGNAKPDLRSQDEYRVKEQTDKRKR